MPTQQGLMEPPSALQKSAAAGRGFWNTWNEQVRERRLGDVSETQSRVILDWMRRLGRTDLKILDVGCGSGWMCERLLAFGAVTGTDLADEVLARAQRRTPRVKYIPGDIMQVGLVDNTFDVIVSLEVLSHVVDQAAFARKMSDLLKPGGVLMIATQNRWVLERCNVQPRGEGQIRQWVGAREARRLLQPHFDIKRVFSVTPDGSRGILRLVNSVKLNRLLSGLVGLDRVTALKERAGLGRTLMIYAVKRATLRR